MAVISLVKLGMDRGNIPAVIKYTEKTLKQFSDYKPRRPFEGSATVNVLDDQKSHLALDVTDQLGAWHIHFVAPTNKFISILLAVQRKDTYEHREFGVEAKDCIYSGFAIYNDSKLLGDKPYLGPFCGRWWSPSDSWLKEKKLDWSHAVITSAQNTINLMLFRYYDPFDTGKVKLHIYSRLEDCPGKLIHTCEKSDESKNDPKEVFVKFKRCMHVFVYFIQGSTEVDECLVSIEPSDKKYINVKRLRMSARSQARRDSVRIATEPHLHTDRTDCHQSLEMQADSEVLNPENQQLKAHPNKLTFKAKSQRQCTSLSDVFARFFLQSTDCRKEGITTITETQDAQSFSDPCGSISLPSSVNKPTTVKLVIRNADVHFFALNWSTEQCIASSKLKFVVDLVESEFPRVTLRPKGSNSGELISWKTSSNSVTITILTSPSGYDLNCPITLNFDGKKHKDKAVPPKLDSSKKTCRIESRVPKKLLQEVLLSSKIASDITWREAEQWCQDQDANLLDIHSDSFFESFRQPLPDECQVLFDVLHSATPVFLGLHDLKQVSGEK